MNWRMIKLPRVRLLKAGLVLPGILSGCTSTGPYKCCVDNCATIPPGAQPAPNGTYVRKFRDAQAAKAEADDFVIYKYEWFLGGKELGPFGTYHVHEIVKRLHSVPFPILLQADKEDRELNEERRQHVVAILAANGIPDAEMRVLVGYPEAEGLYGDEAERIYLQMISGQDFFGRSGAGFSPFGSRFNQITPYGTFGSLGGFGAGGLNPYTGMGVLGPGYRPGGVFGY